MVTKKGELLKMHVSTINISWLGYPGFRSKRIPRQQIGFKSIRSFTIYDKYTTQDIISQNRYIILK